MTSLSDHVLLCRPEHYQVCYAINPWMLGARVDPTKAARQFDALVEIYNRLGIEPTVIDQDPELPDMVFTANAGLVIGDTFVPSNFRYPERAKEAALFCQFFAKAGKQVSPLPSDIVFEGAGDALFVGERLVMGYGFRTSRTASDALRTHLSSDSILAVGLCNPYYYHLDTCLSPLPSGRFLYYPDAFDDRSRKVLESMGGYWVTEKFCVGFGCNMVAIGDTIVTSYVDSRLEEISCRERLKVECLDVSEFMKAGGGVRCLSLFY